MDARSEIVGADAPERLLTIERIFGAPRELVFKCWTEPEHLGRWIGPRGFTSTILSFELREDGTYRIRRRGPDGQDHWQREFFGKSSDRSESSGRFVGQTPRADRHARKRY
jgi:hypothetical protein